LECRATSAPPSETEICKILKVHVTAEVYNLIKIQVYTSLWLATKDLNHGKLILTYTVLYM
jgi:hypothetical protein